MTRGGDPATGAHLTVILPPHRLDPAGATTRSVGDLLRVWRARRRPSQLDLACEAEVSTRHLSFVETGRAQASRDMLLRLAERLDMRLRERNWRILAGGFAPRRPERPLDSPFLDPARLAGEAILTAHEPFPVLAVDRHWHLGSANKASGRLLKGVAPHFLRPPINVLHLSLDPHSLALRILNLAEWRQHLLGRLRTDAERSSDAALASLHAELSALPRPSSQTPPGPPSTVAVPLVVADSNTGAALRFLATATMFRTATDLTLAELTLECFYSADAETRSALLREVTEKG